jgi:RimJ/RimL family protein N-acetyltransferase
MTKGIMIFETPRLYARLLTLDDLEAMHEMQSDEEVMRYTSQRAAMTREETSDRTH